MIDQATRLAVLRSCLHDAGETELSRRQERGLEIAASLGVHKTRRGWRVSSQSSDRDYFVSEEGHCGCPDDAGECKHAFAVRCVRWYAEALVHRTCGNQRWRVAIEEIDALESRYCLMLESAASYRPPPESLLYSLRLEAIGDDAWVARSMTSRANVQWIPTKSYHVRPQRPWVARITGLCPQYEFRREFLDGQKDYRDANKSGSRGVWIYYQLPAGLYEIQQLMTYDKQRRYFAEVQDLQMTEIERQEVIECLSGRK